MNKDIDSDDAPVGCIAKAASEMVCGDGVEFCYFLSQRACPGGCMPFCRDDEAFVYFIKK